MSTQMQAGRERTREEALVIELAEKVMGWTMAEHETGGTFNRRIIPAWRDAQGHLVAYFSEWAPLADLADAWRLVDALRLKGYTVTIEALPDAPTVVDVSWVEDGACFRVSRPGGTVPLAICRAALAALATPTQEPSR